MKALQAIIGAICGLICPIALVVMGYFAIFRNFDWVYLLVVLGVYVVGVMIAVTAFEKEKRFAAYCEMMSGGFGWVWMLSIIASIWFAISALFMHGSWWEFGYSFLVGGICKGWTRSFVQAQREDTTLDASDVGSESPRENEIQAFEAIINKFGDVMEDLDYMSAFHDVDKLPYEKEEILNAIVRTFKITTDQNMKETLKVGLLALSHFQEHVGDSPIRSDVDLTQIDIDKLSPEDYLKISENSDKEKYEQFLQQAEKEYQRYLDLL